MGRFIFNICLVIAVVFSLVGFGWLYTYADGSAKYDGDCTPLATVGRCADKCPDGYYLQGYDKDTGAAVCSPPPTGCPYAERVPVGPECDRLAPSHNVAAPTTVAQPPQDVDITPAYVPGFGGK